MSAAPVVAGDELLPCQSLGIDFATPLKVAVFSVIAVFDSIFGHTNQLAHQMLVRPNRWKSTNQRLRCIGRLVHSTDAGDTFKCGSHFVARKNFPNDR